MTGPHADPQPQPETAAGKRLHDEQHDNDVHGNCVSRAGGTALCHLAQRILAIEAEARATEGAAALREALLRYARGSHEGWQLANARGDFAWQDKHGKPFNDCAETSCVEARALAAPATAQGPAPAVVPLDVARERDVLRTVIRNAIDNIQHGRTGAAIAALRAARDHFGFKQPITPDEWAVAKESLRAAAPESRPAGGAE